MPAGTEVTASNEARPGRFSLIGGCDEPIHERSCHQFGGKVLLHPLATDRSGHPEDDVSAWILERLDLQRDFCRVDHGSGFHRTCLILAKADETEVTTLILGSLVTWWLSGENGT